MAICSFCGKNRKLSREHIWSDNLLEKYKAEAPITFDYGRDLVHGGDPMIKDLCKPCNGGMSAADAAIKTFADCYLSGSFNNWGYITLDDRNLLRWTCKTASNMERYSSRKSLWWKPFVPFFVPGEDVPDLARFDLLLAPWIDMTPPGLKEYGGAQLMGTTLLAARSLGFYGLGTVDTEKVGNQIEVAWALKVNNGIFAVIIWKANHDLAIRSSAIEEAREFGWLERSKDSRIRKNPFNKYTCTMFNLICPQDNFPGSDKIPKE